MALQYSEVSTKQAPDAALIWLHGLGADSRDFASLPTELALSDPFNVAYVFPDAPVRPVTINGGMPMQAWHDIKALNEDYQPDQQGIEESKQALEALIQATCTRYKLHSKRVFLGGFSQGGAMALYVGAHYAQPLAGIIACSAYPVLREKTFAHGAQANKATPFFVAHGDEDTVVLPQAGAICAQHLSTLGYAVSYKTYAMAHQVSAQTLADLRAWMTLHLGACVAS
jgi:phospholipase/carboxylesterase